MTEKERYLSEEVLREKVGWREEVTVRVGENASSGPRDGVAADSDPDDAAVRNVPLHPRISARHRSLLGLIQDSRARPQTDHIF